MRRRGLVGCRRPGARTTRTMKRTPWPPGRILMSRPSFPHCAHTLTRQGDRTEECAMTRLVWTFLAPPGPDVKEIERAGSRHRRTAQDGAERGSCPRRRPRRDRGRVVRVPDRGSEAGRSSRFRQARKASRSWGWRGWLIVAIVLGLVAAAVTGWALMRSGEETTARTITATASLGDGRHVLSPRARCLA